MGSGRARALLAVAALSWIAGCKGCGKGDAPPDAGIAPTVFRDDDLGYALTLADAWAPPPPPRGAGDAGLVDAGAAAHTGVERLAEARRLPAQGRTYLVAPKLVVTAAPSTAPDADAAIRTTMNDLRGIEQLGARIQRSTLTTRVVDGVTVGDIELAYHLGDPRGAPKEVVQRSLVTLRTRADGTSAVWTLTLTYMSEDAELIAAEIQRMLGSLRFFDRTDAGALDAGPSAKQEAP
ncbi:hypothetical protein L6R52_34350 [Myxococcota bacterium]|nr:hypothetical protein [Myxococcota bacterium]